MPSDKRPLCKLCKGRHWLSESHVRSNVMVQVLAPKVTLLPQIKPTRGPGITLQPRCPDCLEREKEIERLHKEIATLRAQNAARQRAYRERRDHSAGS